MKEVDYTPLIKEVCTNDRQAKLLDILFSIERCERELNTYLEQKKKIFPRFYFVSNQTLIDILSNGQNSVKITDEYLGDLFNGINNLQLETKTVKGVEERTKVGLGMNSKEGEYIEFLEKFVPGAEE